jgi:hypothetical protein
MSSRTPPALSKVEVIRDLFQNHLGLMNSGSAAGMTEKGSVILNLPAGRQVYFRI